MALFAQTDIVLPIATAAIAAMATTLAAVLPVWLKLRHERITREIEARKSQKQQGVLESDVDQLENQLASAQSRVKDASQHWAPSGSWRSSISQGGAPRL